MSLWPIYKWGGTTLYEWYAHDIPMKTWWKPTIFEHERCLKRPHAPRSPHWGRDKDDDGQLREAVFLEANSWCFNGI